MRKNMRNITVFILISMSFATKAQMILIDTSHAHDSIIENIYIPKDIEDCFNELSKPDYIKIKTLLLTISEDNINSKFKGTADFWFKWHFHDASRLTTYFNCLGINQVGYMQRIILITFHRRLHNLPIRFNEELTKYKKIESREEEKYQKKLQSDSINGVYIPKNIKECFLQLDKLLKDSDIKQIKELKNKEGTLKFHHGLGTWIRNNWGLWGGSRLQLYILDREKTQPDGMSAKILEFYWEWLNGINENWTKFDLNKK